MERKELMPLDLEIEELEEIAAPATDVSHAYCCCCCCFAE